MGAVGGKSLLFYQLFQLCKGNIPEQCRNSQAFTTAVGNHDGIGTIQKVRSRNQKGLVHATPSKV